MSNKLIEAFLEYEDFRSSKKNETNAFNDALQLKEQHSNNLNKQFSNVDFLIGRLMLEGFSLNDAISFIENINEEEYANLLENVAGEIENYGEDVWFGEIASYLEEKIVYAGKDWAVTDKGITLGGEAGRDAHLREMGKKYANGAAAAAAMRAAAQKQRSKSKSRSSAPKSAPKPTPKPASIASKKPVMDELSKAKADAAKAGKIQGVGRGKNSWADEQRKARAEAVTGAIGVKPTIPPGIIPAPKPKLNDPETLPIPDSAPATPQTEPQTDQQKDPARLYGQQQEPSLLNLASLDPRLLNQVTVIRGSKRKMRTEAFNLNNGKK